MKTFAITVIVIVTMRWQKTSPAWRRNVRQQRPREARGDFNSGELETLIGGSGWRRKPVDIRIFRFDRFRKFRVAVNVLLPPLFVATRHFHVERSG